MGQWLPERIFFAGGLEYAKLSSFDRLVSSAMKALEQDLRDWGEIHRWVERVYSALEEA
jgi:hypothetical protein